MRRLPALGAALAATLALTACSDTPGPTAPGLLRRDAAPYTAQQLLGRYVALGTSNSMGVQSAGIFDDGQKAAWPVRLAATAGVPFQPPLIQDPGCGPPLQPPLALDLALLVGFESAGLDIVSTLQTICMPLYAGITLPTNSVAISGANAHDALYTTPLIAAASNPNKGAMYSRVLLPDETQVTAMLAEQPTFVSIELAANEVLPASVGLLSAMTPYDAWVTDYDQIVGAARSTGARGVLVGLPSDARRFPSMRSAREIWSQWPYLLTLGITVSVNCYFSSNWVFLPGYILTLLSKAPTTATCANVSGAADYVLTNSEMDAINARMALMNQHIQAQAAAAGYAYFNLDPVYGQPKIALNMYKVLTSNQPFGPYMSLDGVHPNAAGQGLLAAAAASAISAKYTVTIP